MTRRPRPSTLDAWIDKFLEWNFEDREGALRQAQDAHRVAMKVEKRRPLSDPQSTESPQPTLPGVGASTLQSVGAKEAASSVVTTEIADTVKGKRNRGSGSNAEPSAAGVGGDTVRDA